MNTLKEVKHKIARRPLFSSLVFISILTQGLEKMLGDTSRASQEVSRLMQENASLSSQANFIQQEFDNQGVVLQNFEARMAALENELSAERNSNAAKDGAMSELKRELELTRANLNESAEGLSGLQSGP